MMNLTNVSVSEVDLQVLWAASVSVVVSEAVVSEVWDEAPVSEVVYRCHLHVEELWDEAPQSFALEFAWRQPPIQGCALEFAWRHKALRWNFHCVYPQWCRPPQKFQRRFSSSFQPIVLAGQYALQWHNAFAGHFALQDGNRIVLECPSFQRGKRVHIKNGKLLNLYVTDSSIVDMKAAETIVEWF